MIGVKTGGRSSNGGGVPMCGAGVGNSPINAEGMPLISAVRDKFRDEFGWAVGELTSRYSTTGSTVQPVPSADRLTLTTGVVVNAVCQALLPLPFVAPAQVSVALQFSAANPVNCDVSMELVDAAGLVCAAVVFPGGSTAAQCRVQTFSKARVPAWENANVGYTISDRVTSARLYTIQLCPDEIRFGQRDTNSNSGRNTFSVRTFRVPDPDEQLFLRIKMANGATAPATPTSLSVLSINVTDINELPVDLTNTGGSSLSESVPVSVVYAASSNLLPVSAAPNPHMTLGSYATFSRAITAATTNATLVKASFANLGGGSVINTSAAPMYLKLFNKATAPVVGTDVPFLTVIVPANSQVSMGTFIPSMGIRCTLGLAWCLTAGALHTDVAVVAAGSIVEVFYV